MNTTKKLIFALLLVSLPHFAKPEENTTTIATSKKTHTFDIKNHRSLFLGTLGLICGYNGITMIKNALETPFTSFCGYADRRSEPLVDMVASSLVSAPTVLTGTALLYLGYKLIANNTKQNVTQEHA